MERREHGYSRKPSRVVGGRSREKKKKPKESTTVQSGKLEKVSSLNTMAGQGERLVYEIDP